MMIVENLEIIFFERENWIRFKNKRDVITIVNRNPECFAHFDEGGVVRVIFSSAHTWGGGEVSNLLSVSMNFPCSLSLSMWVYSVELSSPESITNVNSAKLLSSVDLSEPRNTLDPPSPFLRTKLIN